MLNQIMSEENKYNIKVNPKEPSKEEIQKRMDFEGAFKAYTHNAYRTPFSKFQRHVPKNRKISMLIILAIVVSILVFTENDEENKNLKEDKIENYNPDQEISDTLKLD